MRLNGGESHRERGKVIQADLKNYGEIQGGYYLSKPGLRALIYWGRYVSICSAILPGVEHR